MTHLNLTYDRIKSGLQIKPALLPLVLMSMRGITLVVKFAFTLFIAKYVGLNELGIYGLVSAAGIVSPAIFGLGIMHLLSRSAVKQPLGETKSDLIRYFNYLSIFYFVAAICIMTYFAINGNWVMAALILLVIFLEHINGECYQLMINLSRPLLADILHFTRSASWVLIYMALAGVFIPMRNIHALLIAWIVGSGLCTLIYMLVISRLPSSTTANQRSLWNWLGFRSKQSSWLYLNGIATTGANYSDRYIIGAFLTLELTGVYLFFWQIQSALSNLIYTGLIQIARPAFVKNFTQINPDWKIVKNLMRSTTIVAVIFSILALIVMAIALPFFKIPLVSQYFNLFVLILIAFIFNVLAEVQVLVFYSKHKDHQVSLITLAVFVLNLLGCLCTIPFWGLWGAASTAIFSALIRLSLLSHFIAGYKAGDLKGAES